jgi:hypothetical protein
LHYLTHSKRDSGTGFKIKGSLQMPELSFSIPSVQQLMLFVYTDGSCFRPSCKGKNLARIWTGAGGGLVVPYSSHKPEISGSIPGWAH